uniref:Xylulose kinase-1 n=1 Tax=Tanacetum cinerariifolium TaxID=118510 RepID=A0A6L2MXA1_TANCI|nr:hypothetical protein [Tanacetum cinerariifolium]
MSTPTFADTQNLVVFLEKPVESARFEQIIDFLKSKPIHALTVIPTIYVSYVKQFWSIAKVKRVNNQEQIQALVDKQKVIITKDSIRSDLCFNDVEGTACLFNEAIFKGLARMGTMASVIIWLADNQKVNFPKYIFDNMVKSLEGGIKFYLFPRFLQVFLDHQVEGMARHKKIPQKKQKPKRKQRKEAGLSLDESEDEDNVPTPSSDLLPSSEDSYTLYELMVFYTSLQEQVFDLQEAKDAQSKEIVAIKKKVSKLLKWRKSRSRGLRRLMKTCSGRMIEEIDQDDKIALDADTQGRKTDDEMFGVDDLTGEEVVTTVADKSVKPTILAVASKVTTDVPTPRSKGILFYEQKKLHIPTVSLSKGKGKAKMIEPEVPIKKKDQIRMDEEEKRNVNAFIAMDSEAQKSSGKEAQESSIKRTTKNLKSDMSKKHKVDENVDPDIIDTKKLKKCIEIVLGDGHKVLIKATQISSRSQTIIDYKIHKEGKKSYFKIIRVDGNSQVHQTFEKMFKNFNREDVEVLWAIVKDRFKKEKPVEDMDNLLFRTLKTMFEHHVEDTIWTYQQGLDKVDYDEEMAYDLLRFIRKQLMEGYTPQ